MFLCLIVMWSCIIYFYKNYLYCIQYYKLSHLIHTNQTVRAPLVTAVASDNLSLSLLTSALTHFSKIVFHQLIIPSTSQYTSCFLHLVMAYLFTVKMWCSAGSLRVYSGKYELNNEMQAVVLFPTAAFWPVSSEPQFLSYYYYFS